MPRALFDYIDRGSYDELTWQRNRDDCARCSCASASWWTFASVDRPPPCSASTGAMPVALAPTGLTGFFHRDGEIHAARAAQAAGVPFCLSTMSICSIEDVRAACAGTFWFQLYLMRDRGFNEALIARAHEARCSGAGAHAGPAAAGAAPARPQERPSRAAAPHAPSAWDFLHAAALALDVMLGKRRTLRQSRDLLSREGTAALSEWMGSQLDPAITWNDIAWVRERWPGKLALKGILDADDARLAAATGVDAIIVSNHGGRSSMAPRRPSPRCRTWSKPPQAVARCCWTAASPSGQDVLKALALGARGCLIGKAFSTVWRRAAKPACRWRSTSSAASSRSHGAQRLTPGARRRAFEPGPNYLGAIRAAARQVCDVFARRAQPCLRPR